MSVILKVKPLQYCHKIRFLEKISLLTYIRVTEAYYLKSGEKLIRKQEYFRIHPLHPYCLTGHLKGRTVSMPRNLL